LRVTCLPDKPSQIGGNFSGAVWGGTDDCYRFTRVSFASYAYVSLIVSSRH